MILPVILAGGGGTRLWPLSRRQHPKPFLPLAGPASLFEATLARVGSLEPGPGLVVVHEDHRHLAEQQLGESGRGFTILCEPAGRNTAAAVAAAALWAAGQGHERDLLLILPSDHRIHDLDAFRSAVRAAERAAAGPDRPLVLFGIRPDHPATGYGYIVPDGDRVRCFVEKPQEDAARKLIAEEGALWNSGMFAFTAAAAIRAFGEHAPEILAAARAALAGAEAHPPCLHLEATAWLSAPSISFDYAILEKDSRLRVVPCDPGWSDLGSFPALGSTMPHDAGGNALRGDVVVEQSNDCVLWSTSRLVTAVGLQHTVVVETPDAVLVCGADRAQEVGALARHLAEAGRGETEVHATTARPWGSFSVLAEGPGFKVKRLDVLPGHRMSLQKHARRDEHWTVVAGEATIVLGADTRTVKVNETVLVPRGTLHRIGNQGPQPLVMIEVQCGPYVEEDDIVRIEDDYDRAKPTRP